MKRTSPARRLIRQLSRHIPSLMPYDRSAGSHTMRAPAATELAQWASVSSTEIDVTPVTAPADLGDRKPLAPAGCKPITWSPTRTSRNSVTPPGDFHTPPLPLGLG
jgi:hypothetical protein